MAFQSQWVPDARPMGVGVMVPITERGHFGGNPRYSDVVEVCQAAAEAGFDALWFADHFSFADEDGGVRGVWEVFSMMAAVATQVPKLNIGTLVACTGFRTPAILAKSAEALDEISDGRFILGLGAGWHKPEYDQFGYPFDYRVSRFEDSIRIISPLLREGTADYEGEFFQARGAVNAPKGPRPAGPPILVGSSGDRMLGLIAEFADAWNTCWYKSTDGVAAKVEKLDEACRRADRDPATIAKTVGVNFAMDPSIGSRPDPFIGDTEGRANLMKEFQDLGFVHLIAGLDICTADTVRDFGAALTRLDELNS